MSQQKLCTKSLDVRVKFAAPEFSWHRHWALPQRHKRGKLDSENKHSTVFGLVAAPDTQMIFEFLREDQGRGVCPILHEVCTAQTAIKNLFGCRRNWTFTMRAIGQLLVKNATALFRQSNFLFNYEYGHCKQALATTPQSHQKRLWAFLTHEPKRCISLAYSCDVEARPDVIVSHHCTRIHTLPSVLSIQQIAFRLFKRDP